MKTTTFAALVACAGALAGCARPGARADDRAVASSAPVAAASPAPGPDYGEVMAQVARRFELLGRAGAAGRWELAAYEADELGELFEDDLQRAELPKKTGGVDLRGVAKAFHDAHPEELVRAAKARDRSAFDAAFARAAKTCNGCHEASGHAFIEIPTRAGAGVPSLDPPAASTARP